MGGAAARGDAHALGVRLLGGDVGTGRVRRLPRHHADPEVGDESEGERQARGSVSGAVGCWVLGSLGLCSAMATMVYRGPAL